MKPRMLVAIMTEIIIVEMTIAEQMLTMVAAIRIVAMLWQNGQLQ